MATLNVPGTYPTIAAALAAAVPTDAIVVAAGYPGDEVVNVGVNNVRFDVPASVTGIELRLATGIITVTLLGDSPIKVLGNSAANTINGNAGDNDIRGGSGNDTMAGGAGNDTYLVRDAGDIVVEAAGGGIDAVRTTLMTYGPLPANVEILYLTYMDIDFRLGSIGIGNELDNTIYGTEVDDVIDGGAGADTMYGGGGYDTYVVDDPGDVIVDPVGATIRTALPTFTLPENFQFLEFRGPGNYVGTGNSLDNRMRGDAGDDTLYGMDGNDTLYGGVADGGENGDDVLDGGGGSDAMYGGGGNDIYYIDSGSDVAYETINNGIDTVRSWITYALPTNIENLTLLGTANINGTGNALDNVIAGNEGRNILDGAGGNDTLIVRNTNFFGVNGGAGTDTLALGGADLTLDLTDTAMAAKILNVERIDLTGSGDNTLVIDQAAVLGGIGAAAGAGRVLVVERDFGDTVVFGDVGWMLAGSFTDASGTFDRWVLGNAEIDIEHVSAGSVIYGTAGNDTISASSTPPGQPFPSGLDNAIYGMAGDDWLEGLGGDDVLDGGAGVDRLYGGFGNDTYYVDDAGDRAYEDAGAGIDTMISSVSVVLRANLENLTLTGSAALYAIGNDLDNVLTGNAGNNTIDGKAGADTMAGALGNDTYVVDNAGDLVVEAAGGGTDSVRAWIDYTLTANVEKLSLQGTADLHGTGNDLANALVGNAGNNVLDGGLGADTMTGGAGNDTYIIDNAGDRASEDAGGGIDTLLSSVTYMLRVNAENLTLTGTDAINAVGNADANVLTGNAANNILDGGAGADQMAGGAGNDTYVVDNVGDVVAELVGGGTDSVRAWIDYTLGANVEKMTLQGTANLDGTGNELVNTLIGNAGNNVLDGGLGADVLQGGAGDDTYVFSTALGGGNVDKVIGFVVGDDTIHLDHDIFAALSAGPLTAAEFNTGSVATQADDRILFDSGTGAVYYDADGAGGVAAVKFATLTVVTGTIDHTAFFVV